MDHILNRRHRHRRRVEYLLINRPNRLNVSVRVSRRSVRSRDDRVDRGLICIESCSNSENQRAQEGTSTVHCRKTSKLMDEMSSCSVTSFSFVFESSSFRAIYCKVTKRNPIGTSMTIYFGTITEPNRQSSAIGTINEGSLRILSGALNWNMVWPSRLFTNIQRNGQCRN